MCPTSSSAPLIAVCANQAWNLVNFRAGLIADLQKRGAKILAIAPEDPLMRARLEDMGCTFVPVPVDAAGLSPVKDAITLLRIYRILRRFRPAAWLSWTIKPNVYGSLAAQWAKVPALPNVSGLGTAFIRDNLLTRIAKLLYRNGFRRAPIVFFQNQDDRDLFLSHGLVGAAQTRLLPGSGIDPDVWRPAGTLRPEPRQFLMLARVVADKGVREYVAAARSIRERWPDARFRLMGFLDVANRTAIPRTEVDQWVAEGVIEYCPPVDDVRQAIAAADFIVLPSYREGLSRVLLEAAALARPIVTTDVPGCRDIVREGVNGFLCRPADAASLADALARAASTRDDDWARMASAGRARVIADFSLSRVSKLYVEALRDAGVMLRQDVASSGNG